MCEITIRQSCVDTNEMPNWIDLRNIVENVCFARWVPCEKLVERIENVNRRNNYWNICSPSYGITGDDWECQLGDIEMPTLSDDSDNVYGVNNLSYLQQQLKGYDAESNNQSSSSSQEELAEEPTEHSEMAHDDIDNELSSDNSTSNANEDESSGDGAADTVDETENKADMIPIPTTSIDPPSTVATQLQRLSQIIKGLNSESNQSSDLGPADLNEFLTHEKIKSEKASSKEVGSSSLSNARPFPSDGRISPSDLDQILDLQKKLNKLGLTRDALSTPATPVNYAVTGSGYYPADATTVHINSAAPMQNPMFPEPGYSSSQIVVNRPGGSVLFSLPTPQYSQEHSRPQQQKPEQQKLGSTISEETLKKLLDLSKQMSTTSQPSSIPGFIPPTNPTNLYGQPIIRPVIFNVPVPILTSYDRADSSHDEYGGNIDRMQSVESKRPLQKIASVSGQVENEGMNIEHRPDDVSLSTVIHNHIPITISNPNPSQSTVNRFKGISSTPWPYLDEAKLQKYDSYGHRRPNENTDLNNYYPYPPFQDTVSYNRPHSHEEQHLYENHRLPPTQETPAHYVKISQSPPDEYPTYPSGVIKSHQPMPTFSSDDSSYTTKFYTPQPHLNNYNVNRLVPVAQSYPTIQPDNFFPNRRPIHSPTLPTYMNQVTGYSASPFKSGSSERPYDDDSHEDTYGGGGGGDDSSFSSNQNQDDFGDSAEQTSNEEFGNPNPSQNSQNENMLNLLANYNNALLTQSITSTVSTNSGDSSGEKHHQQKPSFQYSTNPFQTEKHKQFVNLGGNFISLESYQSQIEPFLPDDSLLSTRIEVLTCATGVRQANSTDCTKYFVCNSKTGKVLSYSCPPYTAFNPATKICNAKTYAECYPDTIKTEITIESNKRNQQQAKLTLLQAQRIRDEALKAQQLAHLIKLETQKILDSSKRRVGVAGKATLAPARRPTQAPTRLKKVPQRQGAQANASANQTRKSGKRRIPCRAEGKLADNLSIYNYFLCFKDKDGKMRARRLLCPAKLIFCASSKVCTSAQRCLNGTSKPN